MMTYYFFNFHKIMIIVIEKEDNKDYYDIKNIHNYQKKKKYDTNDDQRILFFIRFF